MPTSERTNFSAKFKNSLAKFKFFLNGLFLVFNDFLENKFIYS